MIEKCTDNFPRCYALDQLLQQGCFTIGKLPDTITDEFLLVLREAITISSFQKSWTEEKYIILWLHLQDHLRCEDHNDDVTSSKGRPVCRHIPAGRPDTSAERSWCSAFSWPEPHSCPAVSRTARRADPSHGSTSPGQSRPPIRVSPSPASPSEKAWWKNVP